jgi:hypothetical protein
MPREKRRRNADDVGDRSPSYRTASPVESAGTPMSPWVAPRASRSSRYVVVHRVECTRQGTYHQDHRPYAYYLDVPYLPEQSNRKTSLGGRRQLLDLENYLDDHMDLSFAVCMKYSCTAYHQAIKEQFTRLVMPRMDDSIADQAKPYFYVLQHDADPAIPQAESLILSGGLVESLDLLRDTSNECPLRQAGERKNLLNTWQEPRNLVFPYLELYYQKGFLTELLRDLASKTETMQLLHLHAVLQYLEDRLGPDHAEAERLFASGLVTRKHWAKLFSPERLVVTSQSGQPVVYMTTSCPGLTKDALQVYCWSWAFDGQFFQQKRTLAVPWPSESDLTAITELQTYPLQYAQEGLEQELKTRGEVFWACRLRKFINYDVPLKGMEVQLVRIFVPTSPWVSLTPTG